MTRTNISKLEPIGEWKPVGTLPQKVAFNYNSKKYPIESLHIRVKKLVSTVTDVTNIGVSPRTNKFLKKKMEEYARKHVQGNKHARDLFVGMHMMNWSPVDIEEAEDFILYVREG